MQEKHGVDFPTQLPQFIAAAQEASMIKFGVLYPLQNKEVADMGRNREASNKKHETKKRNGNLSKSYEEDTLYEKLCNYFGVEDVERWKNINCWSIDLYVKSIDVHIQYDGVYWHGHDRTLEEIKLFKSPIDKIIYETMLRDIKQNTWFAEQGLKLIRVIGPAEIEKCLERLLPMTL